MILSFDFKLDPQGMQRWANMPSTTRKNTLLVIQAVSLDIENDARALAPYKTGNYRRSIRSTAAHEGDVIAVYVGSNEPYGRRLELGFVGTDKLGRRYNQAPRPHLRPALDSNFPKVAADIINILRPV